MTQTDINDHNLVHIVTEFEILKTMWLFVIRLFSVTTVQMMRRTIFKLKIIICIFALSVTTQTIPSFADN